jgi:hypothetical protein
VEPPAGTDVAAFAEENATLTVSAVVSPVMVTNRFSENFITPPFRAMTRAGFQRMPPLPPPTCRRALRQRISKIKGRARCVIAR